MAKGLEKGKESLEWTLLRFFETFNISFLSYLIAINIFFLIFLFFPPFLLYDQCKKFFAIPRLILLIKIYTLEINSCIFFVLFKKEKTHKNCVNKINLHTSILHFEIEIFKIIKLLLLFVKRICI